MIIETLSDYFKAIQSIRNEHTRDIAQQTGLSNATVWRVIHYPTKSMSASLYKIVKWSGISWAEFDEYFRKELEG